MCNSFEKLINFEKIRNEMIPVMMKYSNEGDLKEFLIMVNQSINNNGK
jgi:hypothetical protein